MMCLDPDCSPDGQQEQQLQALPLRGQAPPMDMEAVETGMIGASFSNAISEGMGFKVTSLVALAARTLHRYSLALAWTKH